MDLFYCKGWFRARKQPTEMWSEDVARQAHNRGAHYTVLVGSPERPTCFLEVSEKAVAVGFLDESLREKLSYSFQEVRPDTMFLSMVTYREFVGNSDAVAEGTSYIFKEGGEVSIQRKTFDPHTIETAESTLDLSGNYEAKPSFGHYGDLIKAERGPFQKVRREHG